MDKHTKGSVGQERHSPLPEVAAGDNGALGSSSIRPYNLFSL